jgi:hypothetical protein
LLAGDGPHGVASAVSGCYFYFMSLCREDRAVAGTSQACFGT